MSTPTPNSPAAAASAPAAAPFSRLPSAASLLWPCCILLLFSVVALAAVRGKGVTADEKRYLDVGAYLTTEWRWDWWLTTEHAPLSFYTHGLLLKPFTFASKADRLFAARAVMLLYAWGLGLAVYTWARTVHGPKAGLLALGLWAVLPDTLAHAPLITTDVILACFVTWLGYTLWRWSATGRWRWAAAAGVSLGLALLSKYSAVLWVPGVVLLGAVLAARAGKEAGPPPRRLLAGIALALGLGYVVLCAGYGGRGMWTAWDGYTWGSERLKGIQAVMGGLPLLTPLPWWRGIDYQSTVAELSHPGFLLGEKFLRAPWYYLPVAFLFKAPTPFMVLLAAAPWATRRLARADWRSSLCLLGPPAVLFVYMMCFNRVAAGFRYVYPVLPALCVVLGRYAAAVPTMLTQVRNAAYTCLALCLATAVRQYPDYLAYVNLFSGGQEQAYRIFADSSLDWGQEPAPRAAAFGDPPPVVNPGPVPVARDILVNVNTYHDVFTRGAPHAWLKALPVRRVHAGVWLDLDGTHALDGAPPILVAMATNDAARVEHLVEYTAPDLPLDTRITARSWLALHYAEHGRVEDARAALWMARALELADAHGLDPDVAFGQCLDGVESAPNDPVVRNNAGVAAYLEHAFDTAVEYLEESIRQQPAMQAAFANLAVVEAARGHWQRALERQRTHASLVERTYVKPFYEYRVYYGGRRIMPGRILELWPRYTVEQLEAEVAWRARPAAATGVARVTAYVREDRLVDAGLALLEAEAAAPDDPRVAQARAEWEAAVRRLRDAGRVSV